MKNCAQPLPKGVYAVSADFTDKSGTVTFTFKGEVFQGHIGQNAFARIQDAAAAATEVPMEPFFGVIYESAVVIMPAGEYVFPAKRSELQTKIENPLTLLGEAFGISPNAPADITKPNPSRNMPETVLKGSLYFGTLVVPNGVEGIVTLDGFTLINTRFHDRRTEGKCLGIAVKNCIYSGVNPYKLITAYPVQSVETYRSVSLSDCRLDGFDAMDGEGYLIGGCANQFMIERLYFANTKKFFGMTNYSATEPNCANGSSTEICVRDSVFANCESVHGMNILLPSDAVSANIQVQNCEFHSFSRPEDPVIHAYLPNEDCKLTVSDTVFSGGNGTVPAICVSGCKEPNVTLSHVEQTGFADRYAKKPPRRTEAPDSIGSVVWTDSMLDDPHAACENGDFSLLDALYRDKKAFHGDMHVHTNSGGTSDGSVPFAEFVQQLKELKLDFAAVVDHKQMRHFFLPEWDRSMLIYGSEPATTIQDDSRPPKACKMDYNMLFQNPYELMAVMEAFPEFKFTGGEEGHFIYPHFTPERLTQLAQFIYSLGGVMVHVHPKQLMSSDDPLHYYFTDVMAMETILGDADGFSTVQNRNLWDSILKLGKRVHTWGSSDTHSEAKDCALTTVYARKHDAAEIFREVRDGDCSAGAVGIQMSISGTRMGGNLPYREGLTLSIKTGDFFASAWRENTVYCLKVYTERGLAYASEFNGKLPQKLAIPVKKRMYYRVEITNESDHQFVAISNPIWLDA